MKQYYFNSWKFTPLSSGDLIWFVTIRNAVKENLHNKEEFSIDETRSWYKNGMLGSNYFVVSNNEGKVGYIRIKFQSETKKIFLGLDLDPRYHGRGFSVTIYQEASKLVFELYNVKEIYLRVLKTNIVAINLYKKLGFKKISETEFDIEMMINTKQLSE